MTLGSDFKEVDSEVLELDKGLSGGSWMGLRFGLVQKVASVSIMTMSLEEKGATLFGLVSEVNFVVLSEFVRSMRELAPRVVWTESRLHELFAQLQLLFSRI